MMMIYKYYSTINGWMYLYNDNDNDNTWTCAKKIRLTFKVSLWNLYGQPIGCNLILNSTQLDSTRRKFSRTSSLKARKKEEHIGLDGPLARLCKEPTVNRSTCERARSSFESIASEKQVPLL